MLALLQLMNVEMGLLASGGKASHHPEMLVQAITALNAHSVAAYQGPGRTVLHLPPLLTPTTLICVSMVCLLILHELPNLRFCDL